MTHPSLHRFIRKKGTNEFLKFKSRYKNEPFGEGFYYLEEGEKEACVWERPEFAQTVLNAFPEMGLEMVPVIDILKYEFPELIN